MIVSCSTAPCVKWIVSSRNWPEIEESTSWTESPAELRAQRGIGVCRGPVSGYMCVRKRVDWQNGNDGPGHKLPFVKCEGHVPLGSVRLLKPGESPPGTRVAGVDLGTDGADWLRRLDSAEVECDGIFPRRIPSPADRCFSLSRLNAFLEVVLRVIIIGHLLQQRHGSGFTADWQRGCGWGFPELIPSRRNSASAVALEPSFLTLRFRCADLACFPTHVLYWKVWTRVSQISLTPIH
ncbi:hypothetical protein GE09DRAFT_662005 [Coniochaeta sp. 2T2.1]|nr:hypothetical protein GE09DRAFT_662005 [Coniochaeta sp. 2T2.1]